MMNMPAPVNAKVHQDQPNSEVIIIISPIRFGRGGRAKLARVARNHQQDIKGRAIWRPRARIIVRLCVRS